MCRCRFLFLQFGHDFASVHVTKGARRHILKSSGAYVVTNELIIILAFGGHCAVRCVICDLTGSTPNECVFAYLAHVALCEPNAIEMLITCIAAVS